MLHLAPELVGAERPVDGQLAWRGAGVEQAVGKPHRLGWSLEGACVPTAWLDRRILHPGVNRDAAAPILPSWVKTLFQTRWVHGLEAATGKGSSAAGCPPGD